MDHESERQMELEALEAIFMDDLQVYNGTLPSDWAAVGNTYIMTLTPEDEGADPEEDAGLDTDLQMEFLWAHTAQYPEEPPCIKLQPVYGLTDAEVATCNGVLQEEISNNLGMAMIYTLITAAKEWLRNRAAEGAVEDPEVAAKRAAAQEEEKRAAARAHGHPVTVEAFFAWKKAFDAEMSAAKVESAVKDEEKAKRMTGKAYFAQDKSEINTELGTLSDGEDDLEELDEEGAGPSRPGEEDDEDDEDFMDEDEDDIDWEDDEEDEGMLEALAGAGKS